VLKKQEMHMASSPTKSHVPCPHETYTSDVIVTMKSDVGVTAFLRAIELLHVSRLPPRTMVMSRAKDGSSASVWFCFDADTSADRLASVVLRIAQLPNVWDVQSGLPG
jgi:hypothetical protein